MQDLDEIRYIFTQFVIKGFCYAGYVFVLISAEKLICCVYGANCLRNILKCLNNLLAILLLVTCSLSSRCYQL